MNKLPSGSCLWGHCNLHVQFFISSAPQILHPLNQSPHSSVEYILETFERIAILPFVYNDQIYMKIFLLSTTTNLDVECQPRCQAAHASKGHCSVHISSYISSALRSAL